MSRERELLMSLPPREANYTFVSVHRVLELSGAGIDRAIAIEMKQEGVEAWLTDDPNAFLTHVDTRMALAELMVSGFKGRSEGAEILALAAQRAREYASARRERHGEAACYIVFVGRGKTTTRSTSNMPRFG